MPPHAPHTDIRLDGFLARLSEPWRSYALLARLDRPVGTWLLFLPGVFGIFLAQDRDLRTRILYVVLFAVGSLLMRSAGCIVNDLWDRKIDSQVARTAHRPLASGALSPRQGLGFLAVLLLLSFCILMALPSICWFLTPVALFLVAVYPAAKRLTWWPQLVMGFTFGFGAPMGYAASEGRIDAVCLTLYLGVILWQLGFDTVYGFQDMEDDARIGVKSTSLKMQHRARSFVGGCYGTALFFFFLCASSAGLHPWFYLGFLPAAFILGRQALTLDPQNAPACLKAFRQNVPAGIFIALAFILGRLA